MHRKQFLLSLAEVESEHLQFVNRIGSYSLFLGESSEYASLSTSAGEIHLIGSIFSYRFPELTNEELLKNLSSAENIDELISLTDGFCGHFVIIAKFGEDLYLFHDATGQKEVYYDKDYKCFGSQPKLLKRCADHSDHTDREALDFFESALFKRKKLFPGSSTHKKNIQHLLPNHYLNITVKSRHRFFPNDAVILRSIESIAEEAAAMLKGYIASMAYRNKLKVAVTGGYDSRVLFLASLDIDCQYFVKKNKSMPGSHHDIVISKQLTSHYRQQILIEREREREQSNEMDDDRAHDLDFPREYIINNNENQYIYINGNISEIARNYFGYHRNLSAEDLSFLMGYSTMPFAVKQFKKWMESKPLFDRLGYHFLDLFYWEEKMGNWAAKSKSESASVGRDVLSPFNSRALLSLLLSTERKYRDSHFNKLYDKLIEVLSDHDSFVKSLPVNPDRKQNMIRFMKRCKIYNIYRNLGLKTRKLKT